jgi:hypothetical protein
MSGRAAQFRALYKELRIVNQRQFYEERGKEYRAAHGQAIVVRNTFLVIAALAGVAGQFASGTGRAWSGVVAAVFAVLAGTVAAFEAVAGFADLGKLYDDTALNLARVEIEWDICMPEGDLAAELERVEQILRAENSQWGQLLVSGTSAAGEGQR